MFIEYRLGEHIGLLVETGFAQRACDQQNLISRKASIAMQLCGFWNGRGGGHRRYGKLAINGHTFALHRPGAALRELGIGSAIGLLVNHVHRLGSVILQADPFTRLELLHQLLEVLAPNRPFTQVSPQLHEVAGVLARVVLVRRCAVLQQLATDYGWQGRGSGLRSRLLLRLLGLFHLCRRSLGGSALNGLAFLLDDQCGFALCEALIHLRIGEVDIEAPLRRHVHDGALELLAPLDREGAPEAFPGKIEGDRDAGLAHTMLAQVDRLAGVHEHRLVARLVQVMHVLTEASALRVHVLGAARLGATRRLELIHGFLGSLD
ncbi:hypothetical protein D9M69_504380 [compost metagenome]